MAKDFLLRCLIIAPATTGLDTLIRVLGEEEIEAVSSVELGGGALLADALLDDIAFAVVVLPDVNRSVTGLQATLVEAGVVLGRKIPTLILSDPNNRPPAALASVAYAAVALNDEAALRLHARLFARMSVAAQTASQMPPASGHDGPSQEDLAPERQALAEASSESQLYYAVISLIRKSGVQVEEQVRVAEHRRVDAVIGVSGRTGASLVVLVEVLGRPDPAALTMASYQLRNFITARGADLGLIITARPMADRSVELAPMTLVMSATELLHLVEQGQLARRLVTARNAAVHGV